MMASIPPMTARVVLKPEQARGLIYGLQQPALAGDLLLGGFNHFQVDTLHRLLTSVWGTTNGMDFQSDRPGLRMAVSFSKWVAETQRKSGFPISERFYLCERDGKFDSNQTFEFALPYDVRQACAESITWVVLAINEVAMGVLDQRGLQVLAEKLRARLSRFLVTGGNYYGLVDAACRLDVPVIQPHHGLLLFGTGQYQRCMWGTLTENTSVIGVHTAHNKFATARWLRLVGLPGAESHQVRAADEAVAAARQLGFPVVVKPVDQKQGRGVTADLRDEPSVRVAYVSAMRYSARILVERWVPGSTYCVTVHNEEVVRVIRRVADGIVGDGVLTIRSLLAAAQRTHDQQRLAKRCDQQQRSFNDRALELLRQSGWAALDVPARGVYISLRRRDRVHDHGETETVDLDSVHPDNLRVALDAARLLRLDIADIDMIIGDIASSWHESPSMICEINVQPHLGNTAAPADLYVGIVDKLMAAGCRVPAELVIVPGDANVSENVLKRFLSEEQGACLSHRSGHFIGGERVGKPFADGFSAALGLLMRADVERAVCLMSPSDILLHGSPVRRWDSVRWVDDSFFNDQEIASRSDVDKLVR